MDPVHITARQLAARWHIDFKVLGAWRSEGIGPNFLKLGSGRILYRLADIEAYEAACYKAMPGTARAIAAIADNKLPVAGNN